MIKVYTGNGKGKTTSALGDILIASAKANKILLIQFLKGSSYSGEIIGLGKLGIELYQFGVGCRWSSMIRTGLKHCTSCGECFKQNRNPAIAEALVNQAVQFIKDHIATYTYDLIVLDEVSHALNHKFLRTGDLLTLLEDTEIDWILTGRNMPVELMNIADSWYELQNNKHPFNIGLESRRGIEY